MTVLLTNPRERTRFLRFAVVGIIGAVVDFGTFNLLNGLFVVPAVWASVISFSAAIISNFTWNRFWTYPDSRSKRLSVQLVEFMVISLIGLAIRTPLFAFLDKVLLMILSSSGIEAIGLSAEFIGHNLALAISVVVVMFWNFFVNRYWTYNDVE
jgi:putative flippase GtrA